MQAAVRWSRGAVGPYLLIQTFKHILVDVAVASNST